MHRQLTLLAAAIALTSPLTQADHLEETVVTATHDTRTVDVNEALITSPDT
ncbi:MAG: hypothetical protein V7746_12765 [Halioglobus sp.]